MGTGYPTTWHIRKIVSFCFTLEIANPNLDLSNDFGAMLFVGSVTEQNNIIIITTTYFRGLDFIVLILVV